MKNPFSRLSKQALLDRIRDLEKQLDFERAFNQELDRARKHINKQLRHVRRAAANLAVPTKGKE